MKRGVLSELDVNSPALHCAKRRRGASPVADLGMTPLRITKEVEEGKKEWEDMVGRLGTYRKYPKKVANERVRAKVVDWVMKVVRTLKWKRGTLHAAVKLYDIYVEAEEVGREKLQMVATTAMFMAAKMREVRVPELRNLLSLSNNSYEASEIIETEVKMFSAADYRLNLPTANTFFTTLTTAHPHSTPTHPPSHVVDTSLLRHYQQPSHEIAAAAYVVASATHTWPAELQYITSIPSPDPSLVASLEKSYKMLVSGACPLKSLRTPLPEK